MTRTYLDPKQPMGIEPRADRNIERITSCCLDAPPKMSFFMGKGRDGGGWWMIWMGMMGVVLGFPIMNFDGNFAEGIPAYLGLCAMIIPTFGLSLLWPIHVWKNHYPVRFSRKTRKVYCYWAGETLSADWDSLKAYLQVKTDFSAQGAPTTVPLIHIEFPRADGSHYTNTLLGHTEPFSGLTNAEEAAAAWEYIRRYMEEGPEGLPEPDLGIKKPLAFDELLQAWSPFPILKSDNKWFWPLHIALFFPGRVIFFLISYPTELLYYWLDKKVDMNPFPPEMDEPCRCEDEVVIWHPKIRLERERPPKKRIPIIR